MLQRVPPRTILPVVGKTKELYKLWIPVNRKIPRTERFGIGLRTDTALLDLLEALREATFSSAEKKVLVLQKALYKIDDIRFLFQLLWEVRLISNEQCAFLAEKIETIGKDTGAWRKGVLMKTPLQRSGGEKEKA